MDFPLSPIFIAGDEFYLKEWPEVEGYSFKEVLVSFPKATPIGVKEHASQTVVLNPEDDYVIQPGTSTVISLPKYSSDIVFWTQPMSIEQKLCILPSPACRLFWRSNKLSSLPIRSWDTLMTCRWQNYSIGRGWWHISAHRAPYMWSSHDVSWVEAKTENGEDFVPWLAQRHAWHHQCAGQVRW